FSLSTSIVAVGIIFTEPPWSRCLVVQQCLLYWAIDCCCKDAQEEATARGRNSNFRRVVRRVERATTRAAKLREWSQLEVFLAQQPLALSNSCMASHPACTPQ
ncbi:unnamed protein product, partial [Ectocarpus sp. 12 AP-2014]